MNLSLRSRTISQEKGFTLLELIIVIFLLALISGIAAVFIAGALPAGKFNATVRDLASSVRHARALAQINRTTQAVTIDFEGRKFGIDGRPMKQFPPDMQVVVNDPFAEPVTEGKYAFHFNPSGGSAGGAVVLTSGKKKVTIVIDPVVGSTVVREQ